MNTKKAFYAIISVVITLLLCKQFTSIGTTSWYVGFNKPVITPPNYVFPIVWNIIYILLAISFYKILNTSKKNKLATHLFVGQLIMQVLWCYSFFAAQLLWLGLLILIIMNILAYKMLMEFKEINKITFYMVLPYNIWIFFAFVLNACFVF